MLDNNFFLTCGVTPPDPSAATVQIVRLWRWEARRGAERVSEWRTISLPETDIKGPCICENAPFCRQTAPPWRTRRFVVASSRTYQRHGQAAAERLSEWRTIALPETDIEGPHLCENAPFHRAAALAQADAGLVVTSSACTNAWSWAVPVQRRARIGPDGIAISPPETDLLRVRMNAVNPDDCTNSSGPLVVPPHVVVSSSN